MTVTQFIYVVSGLIVLLIIGLVSLLFFDKKQKGRMIVRALNMSLFSIKIPKDFKEDISIEEKKNRIAVMEQFLSSLGALRDKSRSYGQPYIVLEMAVPFSGSEISFYLAAPKKYETFIEKQIYGFYPKAIVQKIEDYNIFSPAGFAAGGFLKLEKHNVLPIKTYRELEADPLENISTALSKIAETGEGGAIQIVLKSASKNWNKFGLSVIKKMNKGQSFKDAIKGKVMSKPKKDEPQIQPQVTPDMQETIKYLQAKASKTGLDANIRILFSSTSKERSDELFSHMGGCFQQFGSPLLNSLKIEKLKSKSLKKLCFNFSFRLFNKKQKMKYACNLFAI